MNVRNNQSPKTSSQQLDYEKKTSSKTSEYNSFNVSEADTLSETNDVTNSASRSQNHTSGQDNSMSNSEQHLKLQVEVDVQLGCPPPEFISPIPKEILGSIDSLDSHSPSDNENITDGSISQVRNKCYPKLSTSTPRRPTEKLSTDVKFAESLMSPNGSHNKENIPSAVQKSVALSTNAVLPAKDFSCAMCLQTFGNMLDLYSHLKACHNFGVWYVCPFCPFHFASWEICERHVFHSHHHTDLKPADVGVICRHCSKLFTDHLMFNGAVITNHLLNHYYKMYPSKRPYLCLHCDTTLKGHVAFFAHKQLHDIERWNDLKKHVAKIGDSEGKLLQSQQLFCYICETLFTGSEAFFNHHATFHRYQLSCHFCSLRIDSLDELNLHVVLHMQGRDIPKEFRHRMVKEEEARFLCVSCDELVYGKTAFKEHFVLNHYTLQPVKNISSMSGTVVAE